MEENKFEFVSIDAEASEHISAPVYSYWKSVVRTFFKSKFAVFMLIVAIFVTLFSLIQPVFSGYSAADAPFINDFSRRFLSPSLEHPFGTDNVGNSLFDAVWAACGTSLKISTLVTAINMVIGIVVGAIWGYSKKVDVIMMEVYNIFANIPYTLFLIILMYVLGSGTKQMIFAMTCTGWLGIAFFIRVQVMIIRDREYNLASRCLGTPTSKVLIHNVLPYLISVIVTAVARDVPSFISYEVYLSYQGVGLGGTAASLGYLIQNFSPYMNSASYLFWISVFISALISVSLYVVGQALADASDPRTHMN